MNKSAMTALVAAVLLIAGVMWWRSSRELMTQSNPSPTPQSTTSPTSEPVNFEPTQFKDKSATDATIDAELKSIDSTIESANESDFASPTLSNTELGL